MSIPHPLALADFETPPMVHPPGYTPRQVEGRERLAKDRYYSPNNPDKLYNDKPPSLEVIHERIEHRQMAYLQAQGMSNTEIARRMGYSNAQVSQITRQPWFRARLVEELKLAGRDAVESFLKAGALPALEVLNDIIHNPEEKGAVRVAAVNSFLDRAFGKAVQHVKTEQIPTGTEAQKEMADLQRELESVKAQQAAKGVAFVN